MVSQSCTVVHSYGHFCRKVSPLHVGSQTLADKCAQPMKRVSKDTSEAFDSSERRCPWDTTVRVTCLKNCQFSVHDSIIKGEIHLLTKKNINTSLILQKNISMIPKFSAKYSVDWRKKSWTYWVLLHLELAVTRTSCHQLNTVVVVWWSWAALLRLSVIDGTMSSALNRIS